MQVWQNKNNGEIPFEAFATTKWGWPLYNPELVTNIQKNNVIIIIIINSWHKTHIWIAEIKLPKSPIMPRNSTLLKFFTTNSSATFEIPYMMAPHNTRTSPMAWFLPVKEQYHKGNYQLKKISLLIIYI